MVRTDLQEAVNLVGTVCDLLNAIPLDAASSEASSLRRATDAVRTDAEYLLGAQLLSGRVLACFDLATAAGATFSGFYRLWVKLQALAPVGAYARIVRQDAALRATLQMALVSAATDFVSRDEVVATQSRINEVFGLAEEAAADALDTPLYRSLVKAHADVTRDLAERARPLPRIVSYSVPTPLPALVLAQRLYGDAGRADELLAENPAPAPLFMPLSGLALSA